MTIFIASGQNSDTVVYPQVVPGSIAPPYKAYENRTQTITLPSDHNYLASLPDCTRDELVLRADGVAVLTERVVTRVFDGTEGWVKNPTFSRFTITTSETISTTPDRIPVLSNYFKSANPISSNDVGNAFGFNNQIYIYPPLIITTVEELKTWLAGLYAADDPLRVVYGVVTPRIRYSADNGDTWSTIDPAAGTSAITLHKGTNNVWCTDPLSPEVGLDYVQDTNKVINELRAAIVASGANS